MVPNLSKELIPPEDFVLVLGSSSPRRQELCKRFGLPIVVVNPGGVEETPKQSQVTPQEITTKIALAKLQETERVAANEAAEKIKGKRIVYLAADTMVF